MEIKFTPLWRNNLHLKSSLISYSSVNVQITKLSNRPNFCFSEIIELLVIWGNFCNFGGLIQDLEILNFVTIFYTTISLFLFCLQDPLTRSKLVEYFNSLFNPLQVFIIQNVYSRTPVLWTHLLICNFMACEGKKWILHFNYNNEEMTT